MKKKLIILYLVFTIIPLAILDAVVVGGILRSEQTKRYHEMENVASAIKYACSAEFESAVKVANSIYTSKYIYEQHMMLDVAWLFGFAAPDYWRPANASTAIALVENFETRFLKKQDYCMDGCVIKVDSLSQQKALGYTQKVPKWAKAFKFKQESASTKLLDVEWQMGRTGKLTPVGILEPVEIDGSTVSRASLNNMDYINELNLQIGAYVFVEKGGAVIPKVTGVDYDKTEAEGIELNA